MKHFPYALLVAASLLLLPLPAQASRLSNWKFDNGQNRLEFTTDQDVQPKAQLVTEPTRLVIDLPGIILGRPSFTQSVSSRGIRAVRFGQFDRGTTRIVVELAPGYTLNPNQVKFRGITARQWTVQLPAPERLATTSAPRSPEVRSSSSRQPTVYVVPAIVAPVTSGAMFNRAPVTRNSGGPDNDNSRPPNNVTALPPSPSLTTIESVQLQNGGNQLLIQANQPLRYESGWNRRNGFYQITLQSARLAKQIKGPQLDASSPVLAVRLRQEDSRTVVILVQPAAGVQINNLNQPTEQTLALQLQRNQVGYTPPRRGPIATIPVPTAPRSSSSPPLTMPRVPNGKVVVVVDPGHGGPDPGAVGIGGLQEKGIVLDISTQVANLLEKQGVQAVLTRRDDSDVDLEPRVRLAEQINATVFVSIHANSIDMSRPDISGLETYYYQNGEQLARTIHSSILEATGIPDRRVRTARFYVLRKTSMPSVLVEVGFVTGRDDAARLSNPSYRTQMAAAIARGILQYIQRAAGS
ncbi:N-acetylmuramoyl-L-alanine amidase [Kovacikia minuta CCNUW1]|uniref:N-acetylmuramoyl-L-alanine amidase n=1 Tax=Kovacikia minuta TaxID=2931930 RepID=UPI001CCB4F8E|nr:N-acetylmuramoyl-L-alanine amidase [Kovacikia minuta]UBF25922.1 N-acetylmuramoyl-L-alanine amidase [Kovacikia minuta CCNUW1]